MDDSAALTSPSGGRGWRLALAGLLGGATGIAFAPIFVKLSEVGPSATAFWRVGIALPLLFSWASLRRTSPSPPARSRPLRRGWLILPGLLFAGDLGVWHWSLEFTSAANATLLANFAPVFVVLAGWCWLGERFHPLFLLGLALALAGAATLMATSLAFSRENLFGDALGLLTAAFYAAYQLSIKRLRQQYSTATIMTWTAATSCILLAGMAVLSRERLIATTAAGWGVLVGLALLSHICGQGLITWAMGHLPVSFASVSLLWQPVAVAGLAWAILREPVGGLQAAGGEDVVAGIILASRGSVLQKQAGVQPGPKRQP